MEIQISDNTMVALNLATVINLCILSIILYLKKNRSQSNILFIISLTFVNFYFVSNVFLLTKMIVQIPFVFFLANSLSIFYTVFIYLFAHSVLNDKNYKKILFYLSSFLFVISIYNVVGFYLLDGEAQMQFFENLSDIGNFPKGVMLLNVGYFCVQMVYYIVLFFEIKNHKRQLSFSQVPVNSKKIKFLHSLFSLLCILNFLIVLAYATCPLPIVNYAILPILVSVAYFFIVIFNANDSDVFSLEPKAGVESQEIYKEAIEGSTPGVATSTLKEESARPNPISQSERKVLRLIADGMNSKQIAEKLYLSEHTVRNHRKNMLQKLECSTSSEMIKKCILNGWL
jgi:DNA-binding CsgD family transcriptional regulator